MNPQLFFCSFALRTRHIVTGEYLSHPCTLPAGHHPVLHRVLLASGRIYDVPDVSVTK